MSASVRFWVCLGLWVCVSLGVLNMSASARRHFIRARSNELANHNFQRFDVSSLLRHSGEFRGSRLRPMLIMSCKNKVNSHRPQFHIGRTTLKATLTRSCQCFHNRTEADMFNTPPCSWTVRVMTKDDAQHPPKHYGGERPEQISIVCNK